MNNTITIDTSDLHETIKFWLIELFKNEIEEAKSAASNEHLFALGSDGEAATQHQENAELNMKYAEILNGALDQLNK